MRWGLGLIILVAVVWRFWDYQNRWVLNQDQARDATIALYALRNSKVPEIGSPSSAGPFNFGPWYFWLIMLSERIVPTVVGPWIGFTVLSVISVILYYLTGGWITGILAAISVGLVENAPDMLNTVIVGWTSAVALWALWRKKYFLMGLFVGLSINSHFQSWGLLSLIVAAVVLEKERLKTMWRSGAGLATSFLPLLWFDVRHGLVWARSVVEYYTVGVKRFYVPVRWLTEVRDFWPQLFGSVTVGIKGFGYVWLVAGVVAIFLMIKNKKKIERFWLILGLSLLIQVLLMRFYRGVRSREYLIVFHGYIVLICGWILTEFYKLNKVIGVGLVVAVTVLAGWSNIKIMRERPSQVVAVTTMKKQLDSQFPGKISVYNWQESNMVAMPLFYLWYRENKIGSAEEKIGFCDANRYVCPEGQVLEMDHYRAYKLGDTTGFEQLTDKSIYYGTLYVNYGIKGGDK